MNLDLLGGRKFIVTVLAILCTTGLVWDKKISDGVYSTVMIAAIGAYIAGNVTQKAKESKPEEQVNIVVSGPTPPAGT